MIASWMLVAAVAWGADVGWRPLDDGGHELIVQLDRPALQRLERDADIVGEVPPQLDVRRYRLTFGAATIERDLGPPPARPVQSEAEAPRWPDPPREYSAEPAAPPSYYTPPEPFEQQPQEPARAEFDAPPQEFPDPPVGRPISSRQAVFDEPTTLQETDKPTLDAAEATERPWVTLLVSLVLLCCSLGANIFLGWIAWEARARYREALMRGRISAA